MAEAMNPFDRPIARQGTYSLKYEERAKKFGQEDLLPLWVADMDLPSPQCIVDALTRRARHPIYGYTIYPERFFDAIVQWMHKRHGWPIAKETIVPLPGVVPALDFLVTALTRPSDALLIQPPVYHPFFRLATHHDRRLLQNPLRHQKGRYIIDLDEFRAKAKEAKLFILCSPHNPVGRVWRRQELEAMATICLEEGCLIVSDEIHADIVYAPHRHTPTASLSSDIADITITLSAPSKTFNIAGLSTAYAIITNDTIRRRFQKELSCYDLTMGNLFGIEALIATYEGGEEWLHDLLAYLRGNIDYVTKFLARHIPQIRPTPCEATYLMWLDCSDLGMSDGALERLFIQKAKLGLNPGLSFGQEGSGFMRLNIGCPRTTLKEAMKRLRVALG